MMNNAKTLSVEENGKLYEAKYIVEGDTVTVTYEDGEDVIKKSAHIFTHIPGYDGLFIGRMLLREIVGKD